MKKYNKWIFNVASGLALTSVIATSCVDEIKFGNSFLEKAPGGSVTKDTVFNNAEYTRQFLTNLYGMQYYGLPYKNVANQESSNQYVGKPEALTDLYVSLIRHVESQDHIIKVLTLPIMVNVLINLII